MTTGDYRFSKACEDLSTDESNLRNADQPWLPSSGNVPTAYGQPPMLPNNMVEHSVLYDKDDRPILSGKSLFQPTNPYNFRTGVLKIVEAQGPRTVEFPDAIEFLHYHRPELYSIGAPPLVHSFLKSLASQQQSFPSPLRACMVICAQKIEWVPHMKDVQELVIHCAIFLMIYRSRGLFIFVHQNAAAADNIISLFVQFSRHCYQNHRLVSLERFYSLMIAYARSQLTMDVLWQQMGILFAETGAQDLYCEFLRQCVPEDLGGPTHSEDSPYTILFKRPVRRTTMPFNIKGPLDEEVGEMTLLYVRKINLLIQRYFVNVSTIKDAGVNFEDYFILTLQQWRESSPPLIFKKLKLLFDSGGDDGKAVLNILKDYIPRV